MPNLIALFKAKYGVSNYVISELLCISAHHVKQHLDHDSFSCGQNKHINKIDLLIKNLIRESTILGDYAPFLAVLKHDAEQRELVIDDHLANIISLNDKLSYYDKMTFKQRLKFLFVNKK